MSVKKPSGFAAATVGAGRITAWSPSRFATWAECPRKAYYKFVQRLPEPGSPAMQRGDDIHKKAEAFLKNPRAALPAELALLKDEYRALRKLRPSVEGELAFDANWQRVDWFAKNAWLRVKTDALVAPMTDAEQPTARVIDHKTGKIRDGEYDDQLELYCVAALIIFPVATHARGELYFTDHGKIIPSADVPRKDAAKLQKKWEARVKPMLADAAFRPTPSTDACRWCHFKKSNGGPCEY